MTISNNRGGDVDFTHEWDSKIAISSSDRLQDYNIEVDVLVLAVYTVCS
jgi:hypothetical protein